MFYTCTYNFIENYIKYIGKYNIIFKSSKYLLGFKKILRKPGVVYCFNVKITVFNRR